MGFGAVFAGAGVPDPHSIADPRLLVRFPHCPATLRSVRAPVTSRRAQMHCLTTRGYSYNHEK